MYGSGHTEAIKRLLEFVSTPANIDSNGTLKWRNWPDPAKAERARGLWKSLRNSYRTEDPYLMWVKMFGKDSVKPERPPRGLPTANVVDDPSHSSFRRSNGNREADSRLISDAEDSNGESTLEEDLEAQKAELSNRILQKKYKDLLKRSAFEDRLTEMLKDTVSSFPVSKPRSIATNSKHQGHESAILEFSDLHYGETVEASETMDLGQYNCAIAIRRVEYLTEQLIELVNIHRHCYTINDLYICDLGDQVSGWIHEDIERNQDANALQQVVECAYLKAQMIQDYLQHFDHITYSQVVGNHPRMWKKPNYKGMYINWDHIVTQITALFLAREKRITWNIPKSYAMFLDIDSHTFLLLHGQEILNVMGIPWYGINRAASNWREIADYKDLKLEGIMLGHFHQGNKMEKLNGPIIINGSCKGIEEYTLARGLGSRPHQYLLGVHPNKGISWSYPIWLDKISSPNQPLRYLQDVPAVWKDLALT